MTTRRVLVIFMAGLNLGCLVSIVNHATQLGLTNIAVIFAAAMALPVLVMIGILRGRDI